jgi:hypothetical protein
MLVVIRQKLADELEARGRAGEASDWRRRSLDTVHDDPQLIYQVASTYALNAEVSGKLPPKPGGRPLEARRRRFTERALSMLREAADAGFKEVGRLRDDRAFDSMRALPEFQDVLLDVQFPVDPFASRL